MATVAGGTKTGVKKVKAGTPKVRSKTHSVAGKAAGGPKKAGC